MSLFGPEAQRRNYSPQPSASPSATSLLPPASYSPFSRRSSSRSSLVCGSAGKERHKPTSAQITGESPYSSLYLSRNHPVANTITEKFSLSPDPAVWGSNISPDVAEADDDLHNPDPRRDRLNDCGFAFNSRGLTNLGCLLLMCTGLVFLFAGYPLISHFLSKKPSTLGGFNIGGINASGQVPAFIGNFGLVDVDTPKHLHSKPSYADPSVEMQLVFSDEFNTEGRTFYPGDDPYWEAADLHYWQTNNLEWYDPEAITTRDGALEVTLSAKRTHGMEYQGGLMSTWNKFCFTGGIVETSVMLPGFNNVAGLWPAIWTMGNLGRAGYGASLDGMWPYTYDACDVGTVKNQTIDGLPIAASRNGDSGASGALSYLPGQRLSRCTCNGESHPGPVHANGEYVGRAAPEIDVFEAQNRAHGDIPISGQVSQSAQWAPYNAEYQWLNNSDNLIIPDQSRSYFNLYMIAGDHVLLKDDGEERAAVVQSVNAAQRIARLLFQDTGKVEPASLLEMSTYGTGVSASESLHEVIGLHIGDFVFVHKSGTTNGSYGAKVPRIGEIEPWVHEHNNSDPRNSWRHEMHEIGRNIANQRASGLATEKPLRLCARGSGELSWCGEVTGLNLDGTVEISHPDLTVGVYPLNRLTRLMDMLDPFVDDGEDDGDHDGNDSVDAEMWSMDEDGSWTSLDDGVDWADMSEGSDVEKYDTHEPEDLVEDPMDMDEDSKADESAPPQDGQEQHPWTPFMFLPSAPPDHHFLNNAPSSEPSKTFSTRLRKEYKSLDGGLPDSILVRTYEDRTDLWRILIFGPQGTPYQDAPFMIDWLLPSDFPHSPPKAHFHSWTNGKGRVNPNLYEDGKVCLSLLGTWVGAKEEMWNLRSTLLQVFVSVQGLVLIKDPWFLEPGYEKLRGTPQGTVNSRLNRETSYTLSLGFIRHALDLPPAGLTQEIAHYYHTQRRLYKVIEDAKALIAQSQQAQEPATDEDWEVHCLPTLTAGAIILAERMIGRLSKHVRP